MRWPWSKKHASKTEFIVFEEPMTPDFTVLPPSWDLEMSIPVRKVAALFMEQGWPLMIENMGGYPSPGAMLAFMSTQVEEIAANDDALYLALGRMLFIKDEDFPGSVEIYLHVGTASPNKETQLV